MGFNLDLRKKVHLVEIAMFKDNEALQAFRVHPKHRELTDMLSKVADWQVGDLNLPHSVVSLHKKVVPVTRIEQRKERAMTDRFERFMSELKENLTPLYTMPKAPGGHDVWHVIRVAKMGERIRKQCKLTFDLQEYEVAAWLHNMDRVEPFRSSIEHLNENGRTNKESVSIVANTIFESDHPFSIEAKDRIIDVVIQHPKKDDEQGDSHLLTALRIADKLDRLNPLGLMSAVAFRGPHVPLYDPKQPLAYGTTVEGRMKSVYDDFFRVLEWVGMLPSNGARALIVKEDLLAHINFVRAVGVQLSRECGVENTVENDIKKALGSYYVEYANSPSGKNWWR